jgi:hypothetical protein
MSLPTEKGRLKVKKVSTDRFAIGSSPSRWCDLVRLGNMACIAFDHHSSNGRRAGAMAEEAVVGRRGALARLPPETIAVLCADHHYTACRQQSHQHNHWGFRQQLHPAQIVDKCGIEPWLIDCSGLEAPDQKFRSGQAELLIPVIGNVVKAGMIQDAF